MPALPGSAIICLRLEARRPIRMALEASRCGGPSSPLADAVAQLLTRRQEVEEGMEPLEVGVEVAVLERLEAGAGLEGTGLSLSQPGKG